MALISISSILFSFVWVFLVWTKNLVLGFFYETKNHEGILHAKKLRVLRKTISNSTLDRMLLDAMEISPKMSVLVTLSSRKVYVGIVNGIQEPTESEAPNQYISIFPIMSGYRDKDTLSITFTNSYPSEISVQSAATADSKKVHKIKYMDILISADEITHISWFDFSVYDEVNGSLGTDHIVDLKTKVSA